MAHPVDPSAKDGGHGEGSSFGEKLKNPMQGLKQKLKQSHLHDLKVGLIHKKAQIGKFGNLVGRISPSLHCLRISTLRS